MSTVLLDTHDLGEAEEVLSANYTKQRYQAPAGAPTRVRVVRSQLGPLIADEIEFSCDLHLEADALADFALCRIRSGAIRQQFPGGVVEEGFRGEALVVGAHDGLPFTAEVHKPHHDVITVDRQLLGQLAAGVPGIGEVAPVRLTSGVPVSPAAKRFLISAFDYVRDGVFRDPHVGDQALIAGAVERYLAATMLATLPNTALLEPTIEDRHDSTPKLLRRAIAFIDDNADRDVTVSDIAESIWVTPRALQYMFRKHRDCTPMEYLRRVRLHHVHLDLVAANRTSTTVGHVAARWGFGHIGRFAVYYRQQYGQSPHVTLRG